MPPGSTCQRPPRRRSRRHAPCGARAQCTPSPQIGAREKRSRPCTVQASGSSAIISGRACAADLRGAPAAREGAAHELVVQLLAHVGPGRGFAAPPGGQRRQQQGSPSRRWRCRAGSPAGRRLEKGAAQRIGHHHRAGTRRLQQAGHAQRRIGPQFQRVAPVVVQPAQHAVHRLQAFDGLQVQALAAHRQVAAFDQRQAQVTRQVGVLEVGLAVGAGRQQHDARRGRAGHLARRGSSVSSRRR
jgi:hypothetical protein